MKLQGNEGPYKLSQPSRAAWALENELKVDIMIFKAHA